MLEHTTFPPHPDSVADARRFVVEALAAVRHVPQDVIDLAELAVSELATNVVCHASTNYHVIVEADDRLRIAVADYSPRHATLLPTDESVHGLALLQAVDGRWGEVKEGAGSASVGRSTCDVRD